MRVTISVLPVSLSLLHIPRSRLPQLSHSIVRQILQPDPVFLSITSNEIELSIFAESHALKHFEPIARRDRQRSRSRSRSTDFEPIQISCEKWRVLQIDSHSDQLDSSGARVNELSAPLAAAGISILYQSSYMSDFIFVKESRLQKALDLFSCAGFDLYPFEPIFTKSQAISDIRSFGSGAILTRSGRSSKTNALGITFAPEDAATELPTSGRTSPHSNSHSPISSEVVMLSPDLACVGLSDEFGVDHWGLKIVKLVAYPDLILPAKPRSSDSSLHSTPRSPVLDKPILPDLFLPFDTMAPALSPSSPCSDEEEVDDGYFSHSPQLSPKHRLPRIPSRSHSDLPKLSLGTPSKHHRRHNTSSARSSGPNSPTTESQVPFFSFTRTAEGSSLTTDVRLLATLFPPHERHMVICGAELDVADDLSDDDDGLSDLHGSTLKCLQVDLRQFGLDKYGLVNQFSRALANDGINHMYSSTFKTANILVEKRHANRAQHLLSAF